MSYVFLSAAGTKSDRGRQLAEALQLRGIDVWSDHHDLVAGDLWVDEIERKLEAARCVVVLWSKDSVDSRWVLEQASYAREQGTLEQVVIDHVGLPPAFRELEAVDLSEWDGNPSSARIDQLALGIGRKLSESQVVVVPSEAFIVIGFWETHDQIGPTLNVTCSFRNESERRVLFRRLELRRDDPPAPASRLVWTLFYETLGGGVHRKTQDGSLELELGPGSVTTMGVQFRGAPGSNYDDWPAGEYHFRLTGWVDSEPSESANLRTDFRLSISNFEEEQVRRWKKAGADDWARLGDADNAVGIPVLIREVRVFSTPAGTVGDVAK